MEKRVSKELYLARNFTKSIVSARFSKRFVYVASHFQPEKTTTPNANIFQWQELILEILNASIPENWMIYFKEHHQILENHSPYQCSEHTTKITCISDVQFVPLDTNPLIDHSQFVVCCWHFVLAGCARASQE